MAGPVAAADMAFPMLVEPAHQREQPHHSEEFDWAVCPDLFFREKTPVGEDEGHHGILLRPEGSIPLQRGPERRADFAPRLRSGRGQRRVLLG
jgi:hypothetical protein